MLPPFVDQAWLAEHPEAVLAELYRLTPMEETFGINNVALVDGQPRVLGLRELL